MKKIGQKASFLTKILLVIGLLISNLSSLSVVFAYEGEVAEKVLIDLVDDVLEITYTENLAEEVKAVDVKVYENYTYLNGLSEEEVYKVYSLNEEQLLAASEGKLELEHNSIFTSESEENFKLFDGTYSARVEVVDVTVYPEETVLETTTIDENPEDDNNSDNELDMLTDGDGSTAEEIILAEGKYEETITHKSGLNVKVFDSNDTEISLVDGKYPVSLSDSVVNVVAQVLSGGLNPTDVFMYDGQEFIASDLLNYEFSSEKDFNGYLFGEYQLPISVELEKVLEDETTEEVVYNDTVNVLYESYKMNADVLNLATVSKGYNDTYLFYSDTKDGVLYVLSELEEAADKETVVTKTMLDLYNIVNEALGEENEEERVISYKLLKNGINVLESYDTDSEVSLEDYLATITLDETVLIELANEGLTITYSLVVVGDLNNDNVLTQDDVLSLIDQVIGSEEITNIDKSDLYALDGKVNALDVLYLNQVVRTKMWDVSINEVDAVLDATLDVKFNDEVLSEENYLTSGDEFTVDYVLSIKDYEVNGVAGLFNYDKTLFELVSIEINNEWVGNNKDGKFVYLGEESLIGPELDATLPEEDVTPQNDDSNTEPVEPIKYVILTATFKTLAATTEESDNVISLEEIELFNSTEENVTYYALDKNKISTEAVEVAASDDNNLKYLEVAGVEIVLEEGIYEYEITVASDVTLVDLKYILNNVAANVTSTIFPEELAEGKNTVVITVTSESGISQDYTITVIREEVVEEETTQVSYSDNYYDESEEEEEVIVTKPAEEDDEEIEEEKESDLSRIVIIILILLVIAGLVYLIFKDEDDEETKKANKEINKLKKETVKPEVIKKDTKVSEKKPNSKNNNSKNKKKER